MPNKSPSTRQMLDIESPEERQARLGGLFASISTLQPASSFVLPGDATRPKDMKTWNVAESDVLARARAFLPMMQSSNAELLERAKQDPQSVDVENVDGQERVIAMDLGLGVFDVKQGASHADLGPEVQLPASAAERLSDEDSEDNVTSESSGSEDSEDSSTGDDDGAASSSSAALDNGNRQV